MSRSRCRSCARDCWSTTAPITCGPRDTPSPQRRARSSIDTRSCYDAAVKVLFGIGFGGNPALLRGGDASTFMDLVRMAEDYGAAAIGTYDSAFLGGDAYVRATLMAMASSRAPIGLRP